MFASISLLAPPLSISVIPPQINTAHPRHQLHTHLLPASRDDRPLGHTGASPVVERISLIPLNRQSRVITAVDRRIEGNVRGVRHVRRDEVDLGGVVGDADLHVRDGRGGEVVGIDGGGVVELDGEVDGRVLGPVEVEV